MRWFSARSVATLSTRPRTTRVARATRPPSVRYGTVEARAGAPRALTRATVAARSRAGRRTADDRRGNGLGIVEYRFINRHFTAGPWTRARPPLDQPGLADP